MRRILSCLVFAITALGLAQPAFAAWSTSSLVGTSLPNSYILGNAVSDGAGGVYVATSAYTSNYQERVYRLNAAGNAPSGWTSAGVVAADTTGDRSYPAMCSDGSGGVFIAWSDGRAVTNRDIYVQHVLASGAIATGWPKQGVRVATTTYNEDYPSICTDNAGGCIVVYRLDFTARAYGEDYDLYGGRVNGAGVVLWNGSLKSSNDLETPVGCMYLPSRNDVLILYQYKSIQSSIGDYDVKYTACTVNGVVDYSGDICVAYGDQYSPILVPGPNEMWYALWRDGRSSNYPIYAKCFKTVSPAGSWPSADGTPVITDTYYTSGAHAVCDASGDLWTLIGSSGPTGTNDICLQRTGSNGFPAAGWAAAGNWICTMSGSQWPVGIDIDGSGCAVAEWTDARAGSVGEADIYAARVKPDAGLAPGWTYGGTPVATANGAQQGLGFVLGDANGGAFIGWSESDIRMNHIDRFGALGDVSPRITNVRDVPADQGGAVRLQWNAALYDVDPTAGIASYWIWRSTPLTAAQASVKRGAGTWASATTDAPVPGQRLFMAAPAGVTDYAWEYVASLPASLMPAYSAVVPTAQDSMASGAHNTAFMVQARSNTSGVFWSSAADSGHSVDNIPPAAPTPFTGAFAAGSTALAWGAPGDGDVANYVLYRGTSSSFTPGPASLVTSTTALTYNDAAGVPYWYKVAAVDVHGNVGAFATVLPFGTTGVEGSAPPVAFALTPVSALPWRAGALSLCCDLPRAARLGIAVYDVNGREVTRLLDETRAAGRHTVTWDGRGADGAPVAGGLYFVRMTAGDFHATQRVVRLR